MICRRRAIIDHMDKLMEALEELIRREVKVQVAAAIAALPKPETPSPPAPVRPVDDNQLYSVATAAKLVGVGVDWIYERNNNGEIAVVEIGTTRPKQRIRADVLQAFINEHSFGGPSDRPARR